MLESDVAQHVVGEKLSFGFIQVKVALASEALFAAALLFLMFQAKQLRQSTRPLLISIILGYAVQDD